MLERNELARALTELPDGLLLETERTARPVRVIKFRRLIAAAAVIAAASCRTALSGANSAPSFSQGSGRSTQSAPAAAVSGFSSQSGSAASSA